MKSAKGYTVKITVGDAVVEVEGPESGVVKIVEAISVILRNATAPRRGALPGRTESSDWRPTSSSVATVSTTTSSRDTRDIRAFFEEKAPSSDVEAAAAAAYYYQYLAPESERRDYIDSESLSDAFRLARRPLPSKMIYTMQNARNAGYLDSVGVGQYRLNPVGFNLVEHALGPSGQKEGPADKAPRRRKRPGKRPTRPGAKRKAKRKSSR